MSNISALSELTERMRRVEQDLSDLAGTPLLGLSDQELCALTVATEDAGRLLDSLRVAAAGELGDRSAPGLGRDGLATRLGHGKAVLLLAQLTRVSNAEAARRLRLGAATRPRLLFDGSVLPSFHPAVTASLCAGRIGVEAAARIVAAMDTALTTATDEQVAAAERELVEAALTDSTDEIAVQALVWREYLDPDGAEPREARAHRRRGFRFGAEKDGLVPFSGEMEAIGAALLKASFDEAFAGTKPRFLAPVDGGQYDPATSAAPAAPGALPLDDIELDDHPPVHPDGDTLAALEEEVAKDPRSMVQRQHDVLVGLITAGARSTGFEPGGMRSTAQVTAVVNLSDLTDGTGVGWIDGTELPIAIQHLKQIVEASGYATMVQADSGEILWLSARRRYFTTAQITALLVRDGGCVWPGCGARPGATHAHHVIPWENGGPTDVDNGALLCPFHHGMLHHTAYTMRIIRGTPHLLAPPWIDPAQRWIPLGKSRIARLNGLRKAG
jgi:hypothetical protein